MHVVVAARNYKADRPHRVFADLKRMLAGAGIQLTIDNSWSDAYASADMLIAVEPIADRDALSGARLLGQRTLNRFQRMEIAAGNGVPVPSFGSPANDDQLSDLAHGWGEVAVLKYDWSMRRNGVFPWPLGSGRKPFPSDFGVGRDLFMEFLDEDPWTYKIDAFGGTILGSWILQTRSMRNANWQLIEDPKLLAFDPPRPLQESIRAASAEMLAHGVGYASFDLMRASDGFRLIEANTCGASTAAWNLDPERYAAGLTEAIVRTLQRPGAVPEYRRLREQARQAGSDRQSVVLKEKPADHKAGQSSNPTGVLPQLAKPTAEQSFYKRLAETERQPPARLAAMWRGPANMLLRHCVESVPFYRERLARSFSWNGSVDWDRWTDIPTTSRDDVRLHRDALLSRNLPSQHGPPDFGQTSGTIDEPVTVTHSLMHFAVDSCIQARLYQWHAVHPASAMATLWRTKPISSDQKRAWAPPWIPLPHGPDFDFDRDADAGEQLRWLRTLGPVYLRARPSLARTLALAVAENPELRPNLKGILTEGEAATNDHRRLCRKYLGHDPIDAYRLAETGLVAVRCPVADLYHVQSEVCVFEVVDAGGRPCGPGQIGEIIITPLYDFAMPLIRYATGDLAEMPDRAPGPDGRCSCGRSLPAIKRVVGRRRNMFHFPSAPPCQPDLDTKILLQHVGAREWQLAQIGPLELELRYVSDWSGDRENRDALASYICASVRPDLSIRFRQMESIAVPLSGKREDILDARPQHHAVPAAADIRP